MSDVRLHLPTLSICSLWMCAKIRQSKCCTCYTVIYQHIFDFYTSECVYEFHAQIDHHRQICTKNERKNGFFDNEKKKIVSISNPWIAHNCPYLYYYYLNTTLIPPFCHRSFHSFWFSRDERERERENSHWRKKIYIFLFFTSCSINIIREEIN